MTAAIKRKSFGPRISLTDKQSAAIVARFAERRLEVTVENCRTGSVYVRVCLPDDRETDAALPGCEVAKIRLSGHSEGINHDSDYMCIGTKAECLAALEKYIAAIIAEHGA